MSEPRLFIGTSGWIYDHWKAQFYAGVKRRDWLRHYARQFDAVEVNATFYRLQERHTFERWYDETPPHFRFSIKANRFLTHNKKLSDPRGPIERERERARALREKLAVVVWQLPGTFKKNIKRLRNFAEALVQWDESKHAIEFRHSSWFDDEVADCLRKHNVANCQSDASDWPIWNMVTADLVYFRLHGHTRTYTSSYALTSLKRYAALIRKLDRAGHSVHVYFDNDAAGAAPQNASRLMRLLSA